jgi:hypothetical protein
MPSKSGLNTSDFPPVPEWRPAIEQPRERVVDRFSYYTDGTRDFAVFANGTCAVLAEGLSDDDAKAAAIKILYEIFHYHPDMHPRPMDDGNILVQYNEPAVNVVLRDIVEANWPEIQLNHLKALTRAEVLITPLRPNKFDAFGMAALFGRCFMFMDAQAPAVVQIVRKRAPHS